MNTSRTACCNSTAISRNTWTYRRYAAASRPGTLTLMLKATSIHAPVGPKAIRARHEVRLEDRLQHQLQGCLHHPVGYGRDTQSAPLTRFSLGMVRLAPPARVAIIPRALRPSPGGSEKPGAAGFIFPGKADVMDRTAFRQALLEMLENREVTPRGPFVYHYERRGSVGPARGQVDD